MSAPCPQVEYGHDISGPTANRPTNLEIGMRYFDTTLGLHMIWNGTAFQLADGSPVLPSTNGLGKVQVARFQYNPSGPDAKVIGTFDTGITIPAKAIIFDGLLDIGTAFTSGGAATVALQAESAGDLLAATAMGSLTAGLKDIIPVGTADTAVKTTVARNLKFVVAAANLTAGKVTGFIRYFQSE